MATREGAGPPTEATLARELTRVGPLLRRRAAVGPPDPAFVARLRARLLATGMTPDPAFVRALRGRLLGTAPDRGGGRDRRWGRAVTALALAVVVLGLLAAAAVALVWVDLAVVVFVAVALLVLVVGRRRP
jgi:hypothetical protein